MRTTSNFIALLLFLLTTISATAQFGTNNRILFVANMTGQQEVPAVNTAARGVVTFLFSEDRSTISVHGVFSGLSGPIPACHIHTGAEGISGPVLSWSSGLSRSGPLRTMGAEETTMVCPRAFTTVRSSGTRSWAESWIGSTMAAIAAENRVRNMVRSTGMAKVSLKGSPYPRGQLFGAVRERDAATLK